MATAPAPQLGNDDDKLVTEIQAAEYLNITTKALQARRQRGEPPTFIKLGAGPKAPVRYSMRTLRELVQRGSRSSTSQTPAAA